MKGINVSFFSKDKILFGISLEVQKHCDKLNLNGEPIDFNQLVICLHDYWINVLANEYPKIDNIAVIGIDLTKRNM